MANKFHVNSKGEAGECHADVGNCPFGGTDSHFPTLKAAAKAYEEQMPALGLMHPLTKRYNIPPLKDSIAAALKGKLSLRKPKEAAPLAGALPLSDLTGLIQEQPHESPDLKRMWLITDQFDQQWLIGPRKEGGWTRWSFVVNQDRSLSLASDTRVSAATARGGMHSISSPYPPSFEQALALDLPITEGVLSDRMLLRRLNVIEANGGDPEHLTALTAEGKARGLIT